MIKQMLLKRIAILLALIAAVLKPAVAQQVLTPINLTAQASFEATATDESSITVSGQVLQQPPDGISTQATGLVPAEDVKVRFWQPHHANVFMETRTDSDGRYAIGLGEGLWYGSVCASYASYSPSRWQLQVVDNAVKSLQPQDQGLLRLDAVTPESAQAGEIVTVSGSGFGCSGNLRFSYLNRVNLFGRAEAVEYGVDDVVVETFESRNDKQIRFIMPTLREGTAHKHIAHLQYQRNDERSNRLLFSQDVFAAQDEDLENAADIIETTGGTSVINTRGVLTGSHSVFTNTEVTVNGGRVTTASTLSQGGRSGLNAALVSSEGLTRTAPSPVTVPGSSLLSGGIGIRVGAVSVPAVQGGLAR